MDEDGVAEVCDQLGLRRSRPYTNRHGQQQMMIGCPLAPWNHDDPVDRNKSCSVLLVEDGPSYARCFSLSCDYKGSFFRLIQKVIINHKNKAPAELVQLLKWVAKVDEDTIEKRIGRSQGKIENVLRSARHVSFSSGVQLHDRDLLDEAVFAPFSGKLPHYAVHERGITVKAAKVWKIGHDTERGRLVFSVRRSDGKLVGLTGRILPSVAARLRNQGYDVTKYHNYSGLDKGRYLYGTHTWSKGLPVVLVEGPIDAVRTWQALHPRANIGATLGEGFSQDHRRTINAAWPEEVYLFPDGDVAGRRLAEKLHFILKGFRVIRLMRTPVRFIEDGETGELREFSSDPGSMTNEEIAHAFDTADVVLHKIRW